MFVDSVCNFILPSPSLDWQALELSTDAIPDCQTLEPSLDWQTLVGLVLVLVGVGLVGVCPPSI